MEHGGDIFAICRESGWDWREVLDMSASINPLGPAPGVRRAIEGALDRIVHYPDRWGGELQGALASLWSVGSESVLVGNGATELLHFFARVRQDETVTLAVPTFSEFHRACPRTNFVDWHDRSQWPRAGLLVFTQPNNPTGEAVPFEEIRRFVGGRDAPVLIDESFLEFTDLPSAMKLVGGHPRVFVLRSLTKFYALPGLRIGALAGNAGQIAKLREVREPWQINVLAEAAALAAVADRAHAEKTREFVAAERQWLEQQLHRLPGVEPVEGAANYVFCFVDRPAAEVAAGLAECKILVRVCTGTPGVAGEAFRIAVRTRRENQRFLEALSEVLGANPAPFQNREV